MESNCSADAASHGTISGTFQMADATYLQAIQEVQARDPSLAATIPPGLAGKSDPAIEAIAAAQYMYDGAKALQAAGVTALTFEQTRSYFQFGPTYGIQLAQADPDQLVLDRPAHRPAIRVHRHRSRDHHRCPMAGFPWPPRSDARSPTPPSS